MGFTANPLGSERTSDFPGVGVGWDGLGWGEKGTLGGGGGVSNIRRHRGMAAGGVRAGAIRILSNFRVTQT